ncbi:MAG: glutamine-hydrolyzing GMP synthase [Planctomycetes bacterium]|nr:glutamine-hydrolyzing GMP synthase [Planctomycetota bacterium]
MPDHQVVLVLDFGSQYTQLIARRIREESVYCRIVSCGITAEEVRSSKAAAVILSGGPASVYDEGAPRVDAGIFTLGIPVLGICYGLQLAVQQFGGRIERSDRREYGHTMLNVSDAADLFKSVPAHTRVWMSHGDRVAGLPEGFDVLAESEATRYAAVRGLGGRFYGVQFHPEVVHTDAGRTIFHNFLYNVAGLNGDWKIGSFIDEQVEAIRKQTGADAVICGLSGGVDSSVAAMLIDRAVGDRLTCIFVDNGLLRLDEAEEVVSMFKDHLGLKLIHVNARSRFIQALAGVDDPEQKRKIIGREFIRVFEDAAKGVPNARFLAQGTLYPDVIESVSAHGGPSDAIKSHHNVGGLPEDMGFELVEPFRWLFKDEVREVGKALGLPPEILQRHPFPGPGLAVRILGVVTEERLHVLRQADAIIIEEIRAAGLYDRIWQAFGVLLPVQSVGVMGDGRTYENALVVRAVSSTDGMTADWAHLPYAVLNRIAGRIISEVGGINRVVYDISSKPPSTIEWE